MYSCALKVSVNPGKYMGWLPLSSKKQIISQAVLDGWYLTDAAVSGYTSGMKPSFSLKIMVKGAYKMESLSCNAQFEKNHYFIIWSNRVELRVISTDKS